MATKTLPWDLRLAGLLALALAASGCVRDACNNECAPDEVCDATLLVCVRDVDAGVNVSCSTSAECHVDKPHCELDTGRCVQCIGHGDCPSGRCDPFTFTCLSAGCSSGADCQAELGRPYCAADGSCVECRTSSDCPSIGGQRRTCDLGIRQCVANPCREDADCAADATGRVCEAEGGRCVECLRDEHCPSGRCRADVNLCFECLGDDDCDATQGETCNLDTNTCAVTGCGTDASCAGPDRCDIQTRQCVACLGDDDCAFGGICDDACVAPDTCVADSDCPWPAVCADGSCAGCRDDAGCADGQTCQGGTCVEPDTCTTSAECGPGRTCQSGACADAGCTPDAFEPNDDAGAAYPLNPGQITAVLCQNEEDLYALQMQEGAGLEAVLTWDTADGTPTLSLVAGLGGPVIVTAAREVAPGRLVATIEQAGQGTRAALVQVAGGDGRRIPYTLQTTVSATGLCADDLREDDNTQGRASLTVPGHFDGVLCPSIQGDVELDWFALDVPVEHQVAATLTVSGGPASSALVEIHRMVGGQLTLEAHHATSVVSTSVAPSGGARYWVAVRNLSSRKLTYSLSLEVRPRPPANDACADPASLPALNVAGPTQGHTLGALPDGDSSCGGAGGDAFWRLTLDEPSSVKLRANAPFPAVLSLQAGCGADTEVACVGASDELRFDALPAGTYVVRVAGETGQQGAYSLLSEVAPAQPAPVNETCEASAALTFTEGVASVSGNLALAADELTSTCGATGGDAVWSFSLDEPRRVRALLDGFPGASVSLVSAAGCGVEAPTSCVAVPALQSGVLLERFAVPAGDWKLVVDGGTSRHGLFNLRVELSEALYPPENESCDTVVGLGEAPVTADTRGANDDFTPACSPSTHSAGDAVWRLTVAGGEEEVELSLNASFDAALAVTSASSAAECATGQTLACADGPRARVVLPALGIGEYYVWVDGYDGEEGAFTLTTARRPAAPVPANDACSAAELIDLSAGAVERTGSTRRATDDQHPNACAVSPGGAPLSLTGPDVAWRVTVPAGRTLDVTLTPATDFDAALYVLDACDQNTCLGASDSFVAGDVERVSVRNDGSEPVERLVVVDSYRSTAAGAFDIRFELRAP